MTIDTNAYEIAVIVSSAIGVVAQCFLLRDAQLNLRALRGSPNGRRKVGHFHLSSHLALLFAHLGFIYYGIRLTTVPDPPDWPLELRLNFLLFVAISFALLLVGLNQLRVGHALRNH